MLHAQEPQSASTLGLLSRHRQARELLTRSNSENGGGLWDASDAGMGGGLSASSAALPPRLARPQSASGLLGSRIGFHSTGGSGSSSSASRRPRSALAGSASSATPQGAAVAATRHFFAAPLQGKSSSSTSQAASSSSTAQPSRRRPLSAFAGTRTSTSPVRSQASAGGGSRGSASPVRARPASASGVRELHARVASSPTLASNWYCPQAAEIIRERHHQVTQQVIQAHKEQYPLLPRQQSSSLQGASTAQQASQPPLSERGISSSTTELPRQGPPLLAPAGQDRSGIRLGGGSIGQGPAPPLPPLPPDLESGRIASAAPAAPAAVDVAEASADVSFEDFTAEELRLEKESEEALVQLEAIDSAVTALRLQLEVAREDVESSKSELAQLRAASDSWVQAAEEGKQELQDREQRLKELLAVLPAVEEEPAPDPAAALVSARREEQDSRQRELAAERLKVLEAQTERLQDQVASQQGLLTQRLEERQQLETQTEVLLQERDQQRAAQQDARTALRALESQLKSREEALAADAARRQELERQAVRMRGEARGLRARLPSAPQPQPEPCGEPEGEPERQQPEQGDEAEHRAVSLRLQHEVVELWAALKRCDDEVRAMHQEAVAKKQRPETTRGHACHPQEKGEDLKERGHAEEEEEEAGNQEDQPQWAEVHPLRPQVS
eukprot:TRINITY_DN25053_c0_g1_i1.p1 TRINITY_DN25053_c0_g1~~TRINITY_DN25053_c0_g1_i1.p1  ORF type:complete len:674 (-),score=180.69 TRINITY_DN25053_c0_g1_i1:126-2147(-)